MDIARIFQNWKSLKQAISEIIRRRNQYKINIDFNLTPDFYLDDLNAMIEATNLALESVNVIREELGK